MELLNHLKAGRSQGSHPEQLGTDSPELDSHEIPAVIIIMKCNQCMQLVYNVECMLQTDKTSSRIFVMKGNGLSYNTGVF